MKQGLFKRKIWRVVDDQVDTDVIARDDPLPIFTFWTVQSTNEPAAIRWSASLYHYYKP